MTSVSHRLKELHETVAAHADARMIILPTAAAELAKALEAIIVDASALERMLERRLNHTARSETETVPGTSSGARVIDLAGMRKARADQ